MGSALALLLLQYLLGLKSPSKLSSGGRAAPGIMELTGTRPLGQPPGDCQVSAEQGQSPGQAEEALCSPAVACGST